MDWLTMPNIRVVDMSFQSAGATIADHMLQKAGALWSTNITDSIGILPVALASALKILDISHNHFQVIPEIILLTHVRLRILRAVHTDISNINKPIHCRYPTNIQEFDVTNNSINFFHQDVFTKCDWTSTQKLKMGGNMLGNLLSIQETRPFFSPLSGLTVRTWHV